MFDVRFSLQNLSYKGKQTYGNDRTAGLLGNGLANLVEAEANKLKKFGDSSGPLSVCRVTKVATIPGIRSMWRGKMVAG